MPAAKSQGEIAIRDSSTARCNRANEPPNCIWIILLIHHSATKKGQNAVHAAKKTARALTRTERRLPL